MTLSDRSAERQGDDRAREARLHVRVVRHVPWIVVVRKSVVSGATEQNNRAREERARDRPSTQTGADVEDARKHRSPRGRATDRINPNFGNSPKSLCDHQWESAASKRPQDRFRKMAGFEPCFV